MLTQDLTMHYKNGLFSKIFLIKCIQEKRKIKFLAVGSLSVWSNMMTVNP